MVIVVIIFGDLSDHRVVCLEQSKGERNDGIF